MFDDKTEEITDLSFEGGITLDFKLKEWGTNDKSILAKLCNEIDRKYLSNRIPYPYTEENAIWWLNMVKKQEGKEGTFRAIIVDGKYVGSISVEKKKDISIYDSEIGYMISTKYWNRGIATKAVEQICQEAFALLDVTRITGNVYHPNIASQKVLLKNNFVLEGKMKSAIYKDEHFYDMLIYAKYNE